MRGWAFAVAASSALLVAGAVAWRTFLAPPPPAGGAGPSGRAARAPLDRVALGRREADDLLSAFGRGDLRSTLAGAVAFLDRYAVGDLDEGRGLRFAAARVEAGRWALREAQGQATAGDREGAERYFGQADRCLRGTVAEGELAAARKKIDAILKRLPKPAPPPPPVPAPYDVAMADAKARIEGGDLDGAAQALRLAASKAPGAESRRAAEAEAKRLEGASSRRKARAAKRRSADEAVRAGEYPKAREILGAVAEEAALDPDADPAEAKRDAEKKDGVAELEENGEPPVLVAVRQGLRWLAKQQLSDGSFGWTHADLAEQGKKEADGSEELRKAHPQGPGITGLAALALLGHVRYDYTDELEPALRKAVAWLVKSQAPDGRIGKTAYQHSIATVVLVDMDRLLHDASVRPAARKAITWLQDARGPDGGWRYGWRSPISDVSVTGWALQALLHARAAHYDQGSETPALKVDVIDGAMSYLDRMTEANGRVGYDTPGRPGSSAMTAAALFCRLRYDQGPSDSRVQLAADFVVKTLPRAGWGENSYFLFYASDGMSRLGGSYWKTWAPALQKYVLDAQVKEGDAAGAWPTRSAKLATRDPWAEQNGTAYLCSMHCLALENFFEHR